MITVFHEISPDNIATVLQRGILLGTGGDKRDSQINRTDVFLNELRPPLLREEGVDRQTNNYCYLSRGNKIIDITSGDEKPLDEFIRESDQMLVQVEIDPSLCYVSDLDLYDQIKLLLTKGNTTNAKRLAPIYWDGLQLLADYRGGIHRPEVMVPYNIPPSAIRKI